MTSARSRAAACALLLTVTLPGVAAFAGVILPSGLDPRAPCRLRPDETPEWFAVDEDAGRIYLMRPYGTSIEVFDGPSCARLQRIVGFERTYQLATDPERGLLYVSDLGSGGQVVAADLATGSIVARYDVGGTPFGLDVDPVSGRIVVANEAGSVQIIEPGLGLVASVPLPWGANGATPRLLFDPATSLAYVNEGRAIVDLREGRVLDRGLPGGHLALDPDGRRLFLARLTGGLLVLDARTHEPLREIACACRGDLVVDPLRRAIYGVNSDAFWGYDLVLDSPIEPSPRLTGWGLGASPAHRQILAVGSDGRPLVTVATVVW